MAKVPKAALRSLLERISGDVKHVPKIVHKGRKKLYGDEGTGSMLLWPLLAIARKLKGKEKVNKFVYDNYLRRLKNVDERLGRTLAQHGPSQKMFVEKEIVPTSKKIKGLPAHVEHETYSATAPLSRAAKVVTPIAAGMYLSELVNKTGADMASQDAKQLMKQAADAIERYRKRDEAVKLAFLMVEKGKCKPFETVAEFEEKVASIEGKNIDAVREALEMDTELTDFGKVAKDTTVAGSSRAEMDFFHRLSE